MTADIWLSLSASQKSKEAPKGVCLLQKNTDREGVFN